MIKLKVQESPAVRFRVHEPDSLSFKVDQGIPIYPNPYEGPYQVTPGEEAQILTTDHLMMTRNVVVEPIPSNYGRIAYNGTALLVY
jgi:hypothetical protein